MAVVQTLPSQVRLKSQLVYLFVLKHFFKNYNNNKHVCTVRRFCGILTFPQLYSMTASCMDVVYMPSSAIVYAGDCGTVGYLSQLQIAASWVLCNPAK